MSIPRNYPMPTINQSWTLNYCMSSRRIHICLICLISHLTLNVHRNGCHMLLIRNHSYLPCMLNIRHVDRLVSMDHPGISWHWFRKPHCTWYLYNNLSSWSLGRTHRLRLRLFLKLMNQTISMYVFPDLFSLNHFDGVSLFRLDLLRCRFIFMIFSGIWYLFSFFDLNVLLAMYFFFLVLFIDSFPFSYLVSSSFFILFLFLLILVLNVLLIVYFTSFLCWM